MGHHPIGASRILQDRRNRKSPRLKNRSFEVARLDYPVRPPQRNYRLLLGWSETSPLGQTRERGKEIGLVNDRRKGQWIHYRINPDLPGSVPRVLKEAARGAADFDPYMSEAETLAAMPNRPGADRCA